MKKIILRSSNDELYVEEDGHLIPFDDVFPQEKGIINTQQLLISYADMPPFELPEWMLTNMYRNNVVYALIARLEQLKDCDVSQPVEALKKQLTDESVTIRYVTDYLAEI